MCGALILITSRCVFRMPELCSILRADELPLHGNNITRRCYGNLQVVVGNSANWVEAAETLTELAALHRIQMNEPVYFSEPYVGLDEMPTVVDRTYQSARSTFTFI